MWAKIYDQLKLSGIEVYLPAVKKGECKSPYVVPVNRGVYSYNGMNGYELLEVFIYVPLGSYSTLQGFKNEVIQALGSVSGLDRTGNESIIIIEEDRKAYSTSLEYKVLRKI